MEATDFCSQMEKQLETFTDAVSRIEKALDQGGTEAKEKILPVVGDVKQLMSELKLQKEKLEKECPSDWSDEKSSMEDLVGQIGSHIDRTWAELPQGNVGG